MNTNHAKHGITSSSIWTEHGFRCKERVAGTELTKRFCKGASEKNSAKWKIAKKEINKQN